MGRVPAVLFFAGVAEKAGTRRIELSPEPGDTVAAVCERVFQRFPALRAFGETLMFAVDEEYATLQDPVPAGATLALIPPVSGGSAC
jgi:molybdopterin synthase catalytic subunit